MTTTSDALRVVCGHKTHFINSSHMNCIVARWPDNCCLSHRMYLNQVTLALHVLNGVVVFDNYVIIASLKSKPTCKLINRVPGSCLLISSLPDILEIERHPPSILYFSEKCHIAYRIEGSCLAHQGLPVGILLLKISVLFTVEALSCYTLIYMF